MIRCPGCAAAYSSAVAGCPACGFSPARLEGHVAWAPEAAIPGEGFQAKYFARLSELEAGNYWFRARNDLVIWALKRYFPRLESFMEVGCGTGFVLSGIARVFPAATLCGTEIFAEGLGFAADRVKAARFMQMDARRIPYENEFDAIGAFDVLEHIKEDEAVLAGAHRALKAGGGLVLTVPQHPWLWSAADEYACHERRYAASEIHAKVRRAGFDIVLSTSFVSLLLPAMLLSRRGRRGGKFDPEREFHTGRVLNATLETVLRLEHRIIRLGIPLPLGGSRLVVAKKRL